MRISSPSKDARIATVDAFFNSSCNWIKKYTNFPMVAALSERALRYYELFTYNLPSDHYRVVRCGNIIVSIWHDEALHVCATNAFTVTNLASFVPVTPPLAGVDLINLPVFPKRAIAIFERASLEELQQVAQELGIPTSKQFASYLLIINVIIKVFIVYFFV